MERRSSVQLVPFKAEEDPVTSPRFDPTVSLGNVITWAALIITIGVAWGVLSTRQTYLELQFDRLQRERDLRRAATDSRFNTLEAIVSGQAVQLAKNETSLASILRGLERIENKVDSLEEKVKK